MFIKKGDLKTKVPKKKKKKRVAGPVPVEEKTPHIPKSEREKFQVDRNPVKELPSNFLFYPPGVEIYFDCLSYTEIKKLSNANLPIEMQYEIMLEGIHVSGMPKDQLTLYDVIYINLLRKFAGMPAAKYFAVNACTSCGNINAPEFLFTQLLLNGLDKEDIPEIPISAEVNGVIKKFHPIRIKSFIELNKRGLYYLLGKDKKFLLNEKQERMKNQTAFMAAHIVGDLDEEMIFLDQLKNPDDIDVIEYIDELLYHSLKKLPYKCEHCKADNTAGLIGGESIILPFRETQKSVRDRILFGE